MKIEKTKKPLHGWPIIRAGLTLEEAVKVVDIFQEEGYSLDCEYSYENKPALYYDEKESFDKHWSERRVEHVAKILEIPKQNILGIISKNMGESMIGDISGGYPMKTVHESSRGNFLGNGIESAKILDLLNNKLSISQAGDSLMGLCKGQNKNINIEKAFEKSDSFNLYALGKYEKLFENIQYKLENKLTIIQNPLENREGGTDLLDIDVPYKEALKVVEIAQDLGLEGIVHKSHVPMRIQFNSYNLTPRQERLMAEIQSLVPEENIERFHQGLDDEEIAEYNFVFNFKDVSPRLIVDKYTDFIILKNSGFGVGTLAHFSIDKQDIAQHFYELSIFETKHKPEFQKKYENTALPKAREFSALIKEKIIDKNL